MSHFMCHVSCVTCHVSHVTCHMSHVLFLCFEKVVELAGGGYVINGAYHVYFFNLIKWAMLKTIQYKNIWLRTYWRDKTKIIGGHWSLMRHTWPIQGLVHKSWQWIKTFGIYMSDWDKTFVNWEETNTTREFFFWQLIRVTFYCLSANPSLALTHDLI